MEDHDGARAGVLQHIVEALVGRFARVKISTEDIPHDDGIVPLQELCLAALQFAVRRPEQFRFDQLGAVAHIVEVGNVLGRPAIEVVESVVACLMAGFEYGPEGIGMLQDVVAHAKESSLGIVLLKHIEHRQGNFRHRAVIKGQIELLLVSVNFPNKVWKKILNKGWRFCEIHLVVFGLLKQMPLRPGTQLAGNPYLCPILRILW